MATLPRHTAQVPQGLGSAGTVRATNLGALTDTGEQEKYAAKGAKYAAVGDIARSAQGVAAMIYRADQKREAIETDQQIKDFNTELARNRIGLLSAYEETKVPSRDVRKKLHGEITGGEKKLFTRQIEDFTKAGMLNERARAAIEAARAEDELGFYVDSYNNLNGKYDRYQRLNAKGNVLALVIEGNIEGAKALTDRFEGVLWSKEEGKNNLDEFVLEHEAGKILKEDGLAAAEKYIMSHKVDTAIKYRVRNRIRFEGQDIEADLQRQEEQIWDLAIQSAGIENIAEFINSVDASADWKYAQLNKATRAQDLMSRGTNPYKTTQDIKAYWDMYVKVLDDPSQKHIKDIFNGVGSLWSINDAKEMRNLIENAESGEMLIWADTQKIYHDKLKEEAPFLETQEYDRANRELRLWFQDPTNQGKSPSDVAEMYKRIITPGFISMKKSGPIYKKLQPGNFMNPDEKDAVPEPKTKAEYDALKSGDVYIHPTLGKVIKQ